MTQTSTMVDIIRADNLSLLHDAPCSWALLPAHGLILALLSTRTACRAALHVG